MNHWTQPVKKTTDTTGAYFRNSIVCFVRLIQLCWVSLSLIKVFRSTESRADPEHAQSVVFPPSITSTVITFVYSGATGSCLIRRYWGDNSRGDSEKRNKREKGAVWLGCRWTFSSVGVWGRHTVHGMCSWRERERDTDKWLQGRGSSKIFASKAEPQCVPDCFVLLSFPASEIK